MGINLMRTDKNKIKQQYLCGFRGVVDNIFLHAKTGPFEEWGVGGKTIGRMPSRK